MPANPKPQTAELLADRCTCKSGRDHDGSEFGPCAFCEAQAEDLDCPFCGDKPNVLPDRCGKRKLYCASGHSQITLWEDDWNTRAHAKEQAAGVSPEMLAPFADFHGDLPDYDSPLACVFDSGVQYAVDLLAKTLGVEDYQVCDGTEEYDGDLGGTLFNIVLAALPKDENDEELHPSELPAVITRAKLAALAPAPASSVGDDFRSLVFESLYHLRLDDAAKRYHEKAMAALNATTDRAPAPADAWPEKLTPELRAILGFMCFQLGAPAHLYQKAGEFVCSEGELKKRAEDEQAFMLHKFIGYWFKHGSAWAEAAQADLDRAKTALRSPDDLAKGRGK